MQVDQRSSDFYLQTGIMTDPGRFGELLAGLPREIPALCRVVQGLTVHIFWAERYGLSLSEARKEEVQIRPVAGKLARILELDASPLTVARPLDRRLVGNCRDFTLLLTSILRYQGVPARARCGFGAYFMPNHYEDHWVCEYWNQDQARWIMVDSQLDDLQCKVLHVPFDRYDVPDNQFLTGGHAWRMCRDGQADPDAFGIFDMHGLWFVRGDLFRDFLALNNVEILPWDHWGICSKRDDELTPAEMELLDRMALISSGPDLEFAAPALYASNPAFFPPAEYLILVEQQSNRVPI